MITSKSLNERAGRKIVKHTMIEQNSEWVSSIDGMLGDRNPQMLPECI